MKRTEHSRGFTLIELLVVIGIIAILAAIVAIAVNPSRQYGQARDAQRWSDINAIINAVHQYAADNEGAFPSGITISGTNISSVATDYDLCSYIVPTYLPSMPVDPSDDNTYYYTTADGCTDYNSGYTISLEGGRITVTAPLAEQTTDIELTR